MRERHIRLNRYDQSVVERANELLDRMTLDEKVGQMNQLDLTCLRTPSASMGTA
jgi:hypothetical protein